VTVIICANENNIHWKFDSRTDNRARANPNNAPGTYWAIVAAFAGEPLNLIYFHEVGQSLPTYADPYWLGILAYLKNDLGGDRPPAPITDYPEFLSPDAELIKLVTADYLNASCSLALAKPLVDEASRREEKPPLCGIDFDVSEFKAKSIVKYNLPPAKIQTAIDYAQKLIGRDVVDFPKGRLCQRIDSQRQLDELFEDLKTENEALIRANLSTEIADLSTEASYVFNEAFSINHLF
jgi:hypothetical protein